MSVAQPRVELAEMLARYLDGFQLLGLFVNDRRPTDRDRAGDFEELAGGGYGALMLQRTDWRLVDEPGEPVLAETAEEQVFRFNAPTDAVFGYYVRDAIGGRLLWAERWENDQGEPRPVRPDLPGFEIRVRPRLASAPLAA